jgi:hypothetical protein
MGAEHLSGLQFDQARIDRALAAKAAGTPVIDRLRERDEAAQRNPSTWAIGVDHSTHDDLKEGVVARSHSHILLSRDEFPDASEAEQTAYWWGHARGTYPTKVSHE